MCENKSKSSQSDAKKDLTLLPDKPVRDLFKDTMIKVQQMNLDHELQHTGTWMQSEIDLRDSYIRDRNLQSDFQLYCMERKIQGASDK